MVVLAQAWKKSHIFIRRHNSYADVLELDASTVDLEDSLVQWASDVNEDGFRPKEMMLVSAPKNARLMFRPAPTSFEELLILALGQKKTLERHHLFPRQHLKNQGIDSVRDINQIANYALVEWDDNISISDAPPPVYWPIYAERFGSDELARMQQWHALPADWWTLAYGDFLAARRPLIAGVIRAGYGKLVGGEA